jgi:hypothetical protein
VEGHQVIHHLRDKHLQEVPHHLQVKEMQAEEDFLITSNIHQQEVEAEQAQQVGTQLPLHVVQVVLDLNLLFLEQQPFMQVEAEQAVMDLLLPEQVGLA